jgi:cell division FtsZ-interacting protein ZapD
MTQDKIDNMVEHLKGFGSFRQMAKYVLSLQDDFDAVDMASSRRLEEKIELQKEIDKLKKELKQIKEKYHG